MLVGRSVLFDMRMTRRETCHWPTACHGETSQSCNEHLSIVCAMLEIGSSTASRSDVFSSLLLCKYRRSAHRARMRRHDQRRPQSNSRDLKVAQFRSHRRAEQRAIATALSDVDALLGGLDRLIAKKRDLKQAAMQQLLTGQTRLPGFHGEWEVKRLGDIVTILRTAVNSRAELQPEDE